MFLSFFNFHNAKNIEVTDIQLCAIDFPRQNPSFKKLNCVCFADIVLQQKYGLKVYIFWLFSGGDWWDKGSFAGYYRTKINFVCANVTVESSAPSFVTAENDLYVIEFKTSAVCKFVNVKCEVRSDNAYYDLKPLSLSAGML